MVFGIEGFGKKKELVPVTAEIFKEIYGGNAESAFSDNVRDAATDLMEIAKSSPTSEGDYSEQYKDSLRAIKRYLENSEGLSCTDLNEVERLVVTLMPDSSGNAELQSYLSNSALKGVS